MLSVESVPYTVGKLIAPAFQIGASRFLQTKSRRSVHQSANNAQQCSPYTEMFSSRVVPDRFRIRYGIIQLNVYTGITVCTYSCTSTEFRSRYTEIAIC